MALHEQMACAGLLLKASRQKASFQTAMCEPSTVPLVPARTHDQDALRPPHTLERQSPSVVSHSLSIHRHPMRRASRRDCVPLIAEAH